MTNVQLSPTIRQKNLHIALSALAAVHPDDMTLVAMGWLRRVPRAKINLLLDEAERQLRPRP